MKKILLIDADGIVIEPRDRYFSEKFSEEYNVPLEKILPFFKNEYKKASLGKIDLRKALPAYLKRWGLEKKRE
ncbi:MAG: hypothetical protein ABIB61_03385 [Candidatus Shapirobacteria bacterium]